MKKIITALFIISCAFSFAQNTISISQALNLASKQSTLCERLTKEKILNTEEDNQSAINLHSIQFEKNNSILKQANLPNNIKSELTKIEMLWFGFKDNLNQKSPSSIPKAIEFNNAVSEHCELVFNSILNYAKENDKYPYNSSVENLADVYKSANSIKFLSQKLASHYAIYYTKKADYDAQLFESIIEGIDIKVNELTLSQDSSPIILSKTNTILTDWNSLVSAIKTAMKANFINGEDLVEPKKIADSCNTIMKNADLLIRQYKQTSDTK